MIKRIMISQVDSRAVDAAYVEKSNTAQSAFNYENVAIKKPWGFEYLLFQNEHVAIWVLHIQFGFQTSLHCHPNKKSSLIVLSGRACVTTLNQEMDLEVCDAIYIDQGVFHSTKPLSPDGLIIMELETPNNKQDLLRLGDQYGRTGTSYENEDCHIPIEDLLEGSLPKFTGARLCSERKVVGDCSVWFKRYASYQSFTDVVAFTGLIQSTCGNLVTDKGYSILSTGDIIDGRTLSRLSPRLETDIELIFITRREDVIKQKAGLGDTVSL